MNHYFIHDETLPSAVKTIHYSFKAHDFTFTTDAGVFSKDHVDPATDLLLKAIPPLSSGREGPAPALLDMGCGYGIIGIVLAKAYGFRLTQADVNPLAVRLTQQNAERNGVASTVFLSDCFEEINGSFDAIAINPPIHAGKAVTYRMYEEAAARLNPGGSLYVVTLEKHGAKSTLAKLRNVFRACEVLYKKKGTYVFSCSS
jgi:16S rRNA (guanine1207-N2)-methyltransferase